MLLHAVLVMGQVKLDVIDAMVEDIGHAVIALAMEVVLVWHVKGQENCIGMKSIYARLVMVLEMKGVLLAKAVEGSTVAVTEKRLVRFVGVVANMDEKQLRVHIM